MVAAVLYHTIPYHTIPYHTIPYNTIPYHTIPYHTIPYHTMLQVPVGDGGVPAHPGVLPPAGPQEGRRDAEPAGPGRGA